MSSRKPTDVETFLGAVCDPDAAKELAKVDDSYASSYVASNSASLTHRASGSRSASSHPHHSSMSHRSLDDARRREPSRHQSPSRNHRDQDDDAHYRGRRHRAASPPHSSRRSRSPAWPRSPYRSRSPYRARSPPRSHASRSSDIRVDRSRYRERSRSPPARSHSPSRAHNVAGLDLSAKAPVVVLTERPKTPPLAPSFSSGLLSEQELRDRRTVLVSQIAAKATERDLCDFFRSHSLVVKKASLVMDRMRRHHRGMAYVEFRDESDVPRAVGLAGQRLLGLPLIVELSETEKNRQAALQQIAPPTSASPVSNPQNCRGVRVEHLPYSTNDDLVRRIFAPIGLIDAIAIERDVETGRALGTGTVIFRDASAATEAVNRLQQYHILGKRLRLTLVPSSADEPAPASESSTLRLPSNFAPDRTVALQNLPDAADMRGFDVGEDLRREMQRFGQITAMHVDSPQQTALVEYERREDAQAAATSMHGRYFAMRKLACMLFATDESSTCD